MNLDLFVLPTGRPFFDLIFADVPTWVKPGEEVFAGRFKACIGGSFNMASMCHHIGLKVGLCVHLGSDHFSGAVREAIRKAGMSTDFLLEHDRPMTAVTASISQQDDRGFVSYVDPQPDFSPDDLPDHGVPHVVFVPGFPDQPQSLFSYLDAKRQAGSMIVCDGDHTQRTLDDPAVRGLIERLDLFLCNDKEAAVLTGRASLEHAAKILGGICPEVIIKMGQRGAIALEGGLIHREQAMPVRNVETTGAGDGFNAGYLYGLLEGMLVERRLRLGNVLGGLVASCLGGSTIAPSLDQVLALEKKHYS